MSAPRPLPRSRSRPPPLILPIPCPTRAVGPFTAFTTFASWRQFKIERGLLKDWPVPPFLTAAPGHQHDKSHRLECLTKLSRDSRPSWSFFFFNLSLS